MPPGFPPELLAAARRASIRSTRATSRSSRGCRGAWSGAWAWTSTVRSASSSCALDRWDDPHSTIECFRARARARCPSCSSCWRPARRRRGEEWRAAKEMSDYAAGRRTSIVLTSSPRELGQPRGSARCTSSRAWCCELSLREGFGLGASEALWQGTPVVGSDERRHCRCRCATAWTATSATTPRSVAARLAELVSDPGPGGGDGARRARARPGAVPGDRAPLEDELRLLARAALRLDTVEHP